MKSYVITIMSEPKSVESAQRCIDSMPEYDIQMFEAITPKDNPIQIAKDKGMKFITRTAWKNDVSEIEQADIKRKAENKDYA